MRRRSIRIPEALLTCHNIKFERGHILQYCATIGILQYILNSRFFLKADKVWKDDYSAFVPTTMQMFTRPSGTYHTYKKVSSCKT